MTARPMANTYGSGAERGGVTRRDHHVRMVLGKVHVERAAFAEHPRHGALPALAVERDAHSRALGEQRRALRAALAPAGAAGWCDRLRRRRRARDGASSESRVRAASSAASSPPRPPRPPLGLLFLLLLLSSSSSSSSTSATPVRSALGYLSTYCWKRMSVDRVVEQPAVAVVAPHSPVVLRSGAAGRGPCSA